MSGKYSVYKSLWVHIFIYVFVVNIIKTRPHSLPIAKVWGKTKPAFKRRESVINVATAPLAIQF